MGRKLSILCFTLVGALSLHTIARQFVQITSGPSGPVESEPHKTSSRFTNGFVVERARTHREFLRLNAAGQAHGVPASSSKQSALRIELVTLAQATGQAIHHIAAAPVRFLMQWRDAVQIQMHDAVLNYATALCEVSCPVSSVWTPPRPWLQPEVDLSQYKVLANLQASVVKAYIWVMYSAAGTTARLGFATPRPLPPAWTESGWPQSDAQAADPCSPVSYVVPAFRAVFVVQWALIMFQVALAVVLTYQLLALWRGARCCTKFMRGRRQDISTQTGCSSPICKLRFCIGRSTGARSKRDLSANGRSFPELAQHTSKTQVSGGFGMKSDLTAPLLEPSDENC